MPQPTGRPKTKLVFVLNGPNLNLLGKRQPEIYGRETLADVETACRNEASKLGLDIRFHQSNREYEIIDWIHEAREMAAGIVMNPAAFTHRLRSSMRSKPSKAQSWRCTFRMCTNAKLSDITPMSRWPRLASSPALVPKAIRSPSSG